MSLVLDVAVEDLGFPEGPVATADGSLLFVDIKSQLLLRAWPDGRRAEVASLPGGPNGLAIGPVIFNAGTYLVWAYLSGATFGIVKVVDVVLGLRVTSESEEMGLDLSVHGEAAYQS